MGLVAGLLLLVALPAKHRSVFRWTEGDLGFTTAFSADYGEHLSLMSAIPLPFAGSAAFWATSWIVLKAFFCVKFLFGG